MGDGAFFPQARAVDLQALQHARLESSPSRPRIDKEKGEDDDKQGSFESVLNRLINDQLGHSKKATEASQKLSELIDPIQPTIDGFNRGGRNSDWGPGRS